ncbi:translocator protein [Fopius arisanus]|uniref:Translocator protein n=1 Tax=Fopius arisanus TaxID=64838 RepID=A0A9R1TM26_9HYME|nr:PREDICTED: translocator protein [Fopius arisanus]
MTISVHWPALAGVIHPNIGGWAGAVITRRNINPWYESLKKPSWTPPKWAFGPAWTSIYCSVGYASYLVHRDGGGFKGAVLPLSIYGANLALNWAWTPIFFGCHNIKIALYEIVVLWGSTIALAVAFHQVNPVAGYLVLPYIAWNTLATALNYVIYRDNQETPAIEDKKN